MADTKMLQMLIDGQVILRKEIGNGLNSLRKETSKGFKDNKRLDTIGADVAQL